jgi:hypothetical protein
VVCHVIRKLKHRHRNTRDACDGNLRAICSGCEKKIKLGKCDGGPNTRTCDIVQWIEDEIKFLKRLDKLWSDGTIRHIERISTLDFRKLVENYEYSILKSLLAWELKTVKQLRLEAQRLSVDNYWKLTKVELIGEIIKREISIRKVGNDV